MLPVSNYTSKISFALLLSIFIFTACTSKSERNLAIIRALDESLANSNKMLAASTEEILISLREKLNNPGTAEKAQIIYLKAQTIQSLSSDVYNYIEKIKVGLIQAKHSVKKFLRQNEASVYDSLMGYKKRLLEVDPGIDQVFKNSLVVFTPSFDSVTNNEQSLSKSFFENADINAAIAMLTKFQNNIRLNENRTITFCHENMAIDYIIRDLYALSPIAIQSSTIVQSGEQIEITAGIGFFSSESKPEIFVYGKPVTLNHEGIAVYKLKTASKPGKYYVPIKIKYDDQEGRQQSIQKEIEYTVAKSQQQ